MHVDLSEKYKIPLDQPIAPLSPLSFILRKAELGIQLTNPEWQWLENHLLIDAMETIKAQEDYRDSLSSELRQELNELRHNKFAKLDIIPKAESIAALVLYKINYLESLSEEEERLVDRKYKKFLDFNHLKNKYSIIEDIPFNDDSIRILSKITLRQPFTITDIDWLKNHHIISVSAILEPHFSALSQQYKAPPSNLAADAQLLLYGILLKLEQEQILTEDEQHFLRQNGFSNALEIAQKTELSMLKNKYRATIVEDDNPSQHIYKVLKKIEGRQPLSEPDINYLKKRNLHEAIFLSLKQIYDINHRKYTPESPLYKILQKLNSSQRLNDQDVVWLESEKWCRPHLGYDKFPNKVYINHHTLEAQFYEAEYQRTENRWNLASASAHWRKAEMPEDALKLTDLDFEKVKPAKLRQALLTTRGGALRDLGRLPDAEECALEAIKHYPDSHNPYTLMGALCYETGRYAEGYGWFEEASKRGATPRSEDAEIKRILDRTKDQDLVEYLLKKDQDRFDWVKKYR